MKKIKNKQILLAIAGLIVLSLTAGYFIYINLLMNKTPIESTGITPTQTSNNTVPITPPVTLNNPNDKQISGTILSNNKTTITIKLDDGSNQTFKLSSTIMIIPIPTPGKALIIARDPSKIKVGSRATLSLETQNNTQIVTSVSYIK